MKPITREDFFFVLDDNYDEHVERSIPLYAEMHSEMLNFVTTGSRVLDLGCGTGKTALNILEHRPESSVFGIDLFQEMLDRARDKARHWGNRINFAQGDFRTVPLGGPYDVCVTALSLHHLLPEEKRDLYRRVWAALVPNGKFLIVDWTKFGNPTVQSAAARWAEQHVAQHARNEQVAGAWIDHWRNKNIPETVDDMISSLRHAGFSATECVIKYMNLAFLWASK